MTPSAGLARCGLCGGDSPVMRGAPGGGGGARRNSVLEQKPRVGRRELVGAERGGARLERFVAVAAEERAHVDLQQRAGGEQRAEPLEAGGEEAGGALGMGDDQ